ncbi:hypothetical protein HAX54_026538 [Datura stramonium]|uniref:Uncharacterized protein n=1 Tax=Datura stramonium TaxID=4076 RepID=A0ABS8S7Y9_DATST|nr:hypothetical protein [Datura stramonium]
MTIGIPPSLLNASTSSLQNEKIERPVNDTQYANLDFVCPMRARTPFKDQKDKDYSSRHPFAARIDSTIPDLIETLKFRRIDPLRAEMVTLGGRTARDHISC